MRSTDVITAACFWIGTLLPVAYVPVFLAGIDSAVGLSTFLGLVTINVLTLVVGHDYGEAPAEMQ